MSQGRERETQGRYNEALTYFERTLRLAEHLQEEPEIARALYHVGVVQEYRGRYEESSHVLQRALALAEKTGDDAQLIRILTDIQVFIASTG